MIIAAVKVLEERGDKERADLLRNAYLSFKEPASWLHKTKLKLNRKNENVYALQLLQLQIATYTAGLKPSEKRLIGAFEYFSEEISKLFKDDSTESIAAFISKKVDEKLFFTSIVIAKQLGTSRVSAYKLVEDFSRLGILHEMTGAKRNRMYIFEEYFTLFKR